MWKKMLNFSYRNFLVSYRILSLHQKVPIGKNVLYRSWGVRSFGTTLVSIQKVYVLYDTKSAFGYTKWFLSTFSYRNFWCPIQFEPSPKKSLYKNSFLTRFCLNKTPPNIFCFYTKVRWGVYSGQNSYGTSCIGGQTKCIGGHFCMVHHELLLFRATILMQHSSIHFQCCIEFVGALCQNCRSYTQVDLVCRRVGFLDATRRVLIGFSDSLWE